LTISIDGVATYFTSAGHILTRTLELHALFSPRQNAWQVSEIL